MTLMTTQNKQRATLLILALALSPVASAQLTQERLDSTTRVDNTNQTRREAVRIIDNIWWVGHSTVGAFLITSSDGHILIDTTSTELAPWTVESIVNAGFELDDIRYLLNTHTHEEHMGGMALFRKLLPHATLLASKESADVMATGGKTDFRYIVERDETDLFEPFVVDDIAKICISSNATKRICLNHSWSTGLFVTATKFAWETSALSRTSRRDTPRARRRGRRQ